QGTAPSSPARVAAVPAPRPFTPTPPQPNQLANQPPTDDTEAADRPNAANPAAQNQRPPVFNTFPQPPPQRTAPPPPAAAPTSTVTAPVGVAVPGMVVATPQPAGQTAGQPGGTAAPQPR